ncbi:asparagine synthase (glutamine-hydrolyzing) [Amycolatopsis sp. FDAARGOS 1241]|uniref:asparagine synthase (glutamine-hydrolyzing) n=1 Tax=Amycolatopsis sp. FDAARGOS 1241 TaxID=2778070 RepID=UPI001952141A|nr:asparagine synthase (glutamine-hydrolyzing) [Amycolatopsis sp. FDAARGOS 1241]QRP50645.1 asparagine synthase (glutamine-hydrolyzing) [Amycolatopsis sp. FDAARGOS 1241]
MCGITGWVDFGRDLAAERETVAAMTATMACRGPDASGLWFDRHAAFGHRRLSIIDLELGKQPMTADAGGTVALTYSGEVYNFAELRAELETRGHRFTTHSDTEVVLRGYLEWGAGLAEHLNGMYAFAIWDPREERLVLIRDRMGIKPLYYSLLGDGLLFGSEPKAILAHPDVKPVLDADGLRELLVFTKNPGQAVWAGLREVEPGTVVTLDRTGLKVRRYWQLQPDEHTDDIGVTVHQVRELLDDVVRRQLVADVPRCVLLSGGLDSSVLTALSAQQLADQGEQVRSFAVDFVGQEENFVPDAMRSTPDAPYVRDVHEHVGSLHQDIVLDSAELADPAVRRAVVRARDLPTGLGDLDGSLYLLFRAIRERSTVALSGESADEVFGGYAWFHDPQVQQADTFPWLARRLASGARGSVAGIFDPGLLSTLDLRAHLRDSYSAAVAEAGTRPGETEHERRMRVIGYLHLTRFVRILLDRKDRLSMANGLEVRVPFCDHRLVEYVYNTPWTTKTFDGREKSLLRAAARDVLPASVAERVKSPYPSTQDPKYLEALREQAGDLLASPAHGVFDLIDRRALTELLAREDTGGFLRPQLERVLFFATWFDLYSPELRVR